MCAWCSAGNRCAFPGCGDAAPGCAEATWSLLLPEIPVTAGGGGSCRRTQNRPERGVVMEARLGKDGEEEEDGRKTGAALKP